MNKKLLATAMGVALAAGPMLAAQAGVKVYGKANAEVATETLQIDTDGDGTNDGADKAGFTLEDNARGRFGVKASEDLGGGLKGIANFEWKVDTTDNDTSKGNKISLSPRQSFVGLKGSGWGTFMIGNVLSPTKYYGGVKYDPFVTTNLEARKNGGMSSGRADGGDTGGKWGHNSFIDNMLAYKTPNWGGFEGWAIYSPDQNGDNRNVEDPPCTDDDGCAGVGTGNYGSYNVGLKFGMKGAVPWEVGVTRLFRNSRDNSTGGTGDYTAQKVFGKVKVGGKIHHTVQFQYEQNTQDKDNGVAAQKDANETIAYLNYILGVGKTWQIVASYAQNKVENYGNTPSSNVGRDDQNGTFTRVGANYFFSKKTRVYFGWRATTYDNYKGVENAEKIATAITVGLRKDF